ncbi:MAG: cysteine desulfurase [Acidobacteria bacterium]|nr:MAG: cysteine desulfurase [Acidobacteriota bacterium]
MIYLDNAATSFPKPEAVYRMLDHYLREVGANPGRSGHRRAVEAERLIGEARRALASLLGVSDPDRIIFGHNATDGLNIALKGFLRPGDHVVTSDLEHNSITRPLTGLEKKGWITVSRIASRAGFIEPAEVRSALGPQTRLVAVTHGSNVFGTIQPIGEIAEVAHAGGARILVDAAQTAGVAPLDIEAMGLDMVAFTGHKSLLGPMGTGGLALLPGVDPEPWREGGTGTDSSNPLHPRNYPAKLEGGTPNAAGIAALAEGARYVARRTPEAVRRHEVSLAALLRELVAGDERFTLHGGGDPSRELGIVSFTVRGYSPNEFAAALDEAYDIAVRPGLHCAPGAHRSLGTWPDGTVRVSTGPFTTEEEIRDAVRAMREIAAAAA